MFGRRSTIDELQTDVAVRKETEGALQAALVEQEQLLRALEVQQERLETIISNVPGLVWEFWWDADEGTPRAGFVSDYVEEMLGYTPEEWHATPDAWMNAVHPEDRERIARSVRTLAAAGPRGSDDVTDEARFIRKDGRVVWTSVHMRVVRDAQGRSAGLCGVTLDISARKEAERTLQESEARYRTIVETVQEGIWIVDADARATFVNRKMAEMIGCRVEDMIGRTPFSFMDEAERPMAAESLARVAQGHSEQRDFRFRRRDGSDLWAIVSCSPHFDAGGVFIGGLATVADITARREDEQRVRTSQRRLAEAERIAHLGHWTWEVAEDRALWSDEHYRIFGLDPDGGRALSWAELVEWLHPEDRDSVRDLVERTVRSGAPFHYQARFLLPDGTMRVLESRATPELGADGAVVRLLGTVQDITERRQTEEALRHAQKMEAVGVLAGGVAHDFNNLLTVINGFADLLRAQADGSDPRAAYLDEIRKAGERAVSLTRHLLAFSRRQILQPKVLDLNTVVGEMGTLLRRLIGEDIELRTIMAPDLAPVHADPGQLGQVLLNLATNARDAMPTGGQLTIETENVEIERATTGFPEALPPGHYVRLAVSDSGRGMDAATRARVFEPFFTTKEPGKGTGLGLSMVYGIVKQSGGDVTVYSESGRGTTFKVYLPRYVGVEDQGMPEEPSREAPGGWETVLLVEDEPGVAELVRNVLAGAGYRVLSATDPLVALTLTEEHPEPIHLLLTDVVMPGMGGRELAGKLGPRRPEMRVLYMSGYTPDVALRHGVSEAMVAFVQKPVSPTALLRRVREVLDGPPPERSAGRDLAVVC